jgi:hypothetical protein
MPWTCKPVKMGVLRQEEPENGAKLATVSKKKSGNWLFSELAR